MPRGSFHRRRSIVLRSDFDTSQIPVLIICRDRVSPLRQLVAWLESVGHERIIFVDNDSTFEPLLSYYEQTPYQVLRLGRNLGHLAVWEGNVIDTIGHDGAYVVTDADVVPDPDAPPDALAYFADLLFRYSDVDKVGFGLRIDDLPDTFQFRAEVIDWESQFWEVEEEPGVYRADIDTTFALYRPTAPKGSYRALRTGPPYVARHLPWYSDSANLSEEDKYYRAHALPGVSNWDVATIPDGLKQAIAARRAQSGVSVAGDDEPAVVSASEIIRTEQPVSNSECPDSVAAALSDELELERAARQAAEEELVAIRQSRSYRWMAPARHLRRFTINKPF